MSTKAVFTLMIIFSLLVVTFLVLQVLSVPAANNPGEGNSADAQRLVGSDWIERHP
jgi:hypothetical protein